MDATNLAMMVTPNLLKGSNPVRDIMMSSVPVRTAGMGMSAGTAISTFAPESSEQSGNAEGKTTLGMVIAFCIRRYYEVFDEVTDRSEAVAPWRTIETAAGGAMGEDASGTYVLGEDEDLDDELSDIHANAGPSNRLSAAFKRHRQKNSVESNTLSTSVRSFYEGSTGTSPSAWNTRFPPNLYATATTNGKARSVISIENAAGSASAIGNATLRRGSITIGKGAARKGSGSAVEAVSVTASGFFAPPAGAPAVPAMPSSPTSASSRTAEPEEEDRALNVAERRRMFEGDRV
jgi:Rho GTPase-activating protein 1